MGPILQDVEREVTQSKDRAMIEDEKQELARGYINLKDHFDCLLSERQKRMDDRLEAQKTALAKSNEELERRLEALNELRSAVEKDRSQFVKVDTYELKTKWYDEWVRGVDKKLTAQDSRYATWLVSLGLIMAAIQVILHFWTK
jgi:hypothetical protein